MNDKIVRDPVEQRSLLLLSAFQKFPKDSLEVDSFATGYRFKKQKENRWKIHEIHAAETRASEKASG